jgi:N-acetylglucosaminyldiphosphoundecaprenol N-acetyl-beta-D-mannosaminyltransferase
MTIDRGKQSVLGIGINVIDYAGALERIMEAARQKRSLSVSALAVHGVMTGALDAAHRFRLNRLDIVTPDGQPVRWALALLYGEKLPDRVYGPRLTELTCERAAELGLSVYLFGSRRDVLEAWVARLRTSLPQLGIAGYEPSRFRRLTPEEDAELDARIRASGADLVLVGLGCPRQEIFAYEHAGALSRPILAVGAAFDFEAGLRQAPPWMQRAGLEWLFRLWHEPRRLWRRYLLLNPLYCVMIAAQGLGLLRQQLLREQLPTPQRYG